MQFAASLHHYLEWQIDLKFGAAVPRNSRMMRSEPSWTRSTRSTKSQCRTKRRAHHCKAWAKHQVKIANSKQIWKSLKISGKIHIIIAWYFQTGVHSRHDGTINMMSWLWFDYQAGFGWSPMRKEWIWSNNALCLATCLNFQSEQKVLKRSFSPLSTLHFLAMLVSAIMFFMFISFCRFSRVVVYLMSVPLGRPRPHSRWFNLPRSRVSTPRESSKTERKKELQKVENSPYVASQLWKVETIKRFSRNPKE